MSQFEFLEPEDWNRLLDRVETLEAAGGGLPMVWHEIVDVKKQDQTGKIYITLPNASMTVKFKMWGQFYRSPANADFLKSHQHPSVGDHSHSYKIQEGENYQGFGNHWTSVGTKSGHILGGGGHDHPAASAGSGLTTTNAPKSVQIWIDGTDRTSALGGPWGDGTSEFAIGEKDISAYVTGSGEHYIEIILDATLGTVGGRIQYEIQAS